MKKLINKIIMYVMSPLFKIIGVIEITVAIFYLFGLIVPNNSDFVLPMHMIIVGLFFLLIKLNTFKEDS